MSQLGHPFNQLKLLDLCVNIVAFSRISSSKYKVRCFHVPRHHPQQAVGSNCLLILHRFLVIAAVFHHGVQDCDQFSGGCDQGDFGGFACGLEPFSKGAQGWVIAAGDEGGEVKCAPYICPPAPDAAFALEQSAVAGVRSKA